MNKLTPTRFKWKDIPSLLKDTYVEWDKVNPYRLSAVVAYYAVLSLPGLLVILINTVGAIWGEEIVSGRFTAEIAAAMGNDTADAVKVMIEETQGVQKSTISTIIAIATIIFGATGVFFQLQISLNKIWGVESKLKEGIFALVTNRARSLGFIMVIGFLLLISFLVTTLISSMNEYLAKVFPDLVVYLAYVFDYIISLSVISTLFAMMFKFLPDVKIPWKTVWIGGVITALLFVLGKFLLGLYFGKSDPGSTYGAAGSVVLILLWVSYSALIFFFGAEFTNQFSKRYNLPEKELSGEDKDKFV